MAQKSLTGVLQHIHKLAAVQTGRRLGDRELIARFLEANDEAAFTVLVERHGPMVRGVCYRLLRNTHDADDACQAVFLVLARKAPSLRKKESVGSWLHGIAWRVAASLKRGNARRRFREHALVRPASESGEEAVAWQDALAVLDEELQKVPERYRAPLILCYLEGKARDEAAERLGLKPGTLHGRLERGRKLLRQNLARRGLTFSVGLLAMVLAEGSAPAALSPTAAIATTKAALAYAGGSSSAAGLASPLVLSLTQEVLKTMVLTNIKIATAVVLMIGVVAAGTGFTSHAVMAAESQEAKQNRLPKPNEQPDKATSEFHGKRSDNEDKKQQTAHEPIKGSLADRFAKLKREYEADYGRTIVEIKDPKTGDVVSQEQIKQVPARKYLVELLELGQGDDETTAVAALTLAVWAWPNDSRADDAFDLLLKRFAAKPCLAELPRTLQLQWNPDKEKRLQRLVAEAKDPATLALSLLDLGRAYDPMSVRIQGEPEERAAARREKALSYYRRVVAEFPKAEDGKPAKTAQRYITRLQQLRVGKLAPALAGKDLEGKEMTLEDFRGKVVVLDFSGSWCGACLKKLPMLKGVAAAYADKGVVFLGVMSEENAKDAKRALKEHKVPWRNWLDLRDEHGEGPIVRSWGVCGFPSIMVLDGKGMIRFIEVLERDELERALDSLLAEARSK